MNISILNQPVKDFESCILIGQFLIPGVTFQKHLGTERRVHLILSSFPHILLVMHIVRSLLHTTDSSLIIVGKLLWLTCNCMQCTLLWLS